MLSLRPWRARQSERTSSAFGSAPAARESNLKRVVTLPQEEHPRHQPFRTSCGHGPISRIVVYEEVLAEGQRPHHSSRSNISPPYGSGGTWRCRQISPITSNPSSTAGPPGTHEVLVILRGRHNPDVLAAQGGPRQPSPT